MPVSSSGPLELEPSLLPGIRTRFFCLEKEAEAGNEDTGERAVWSLCAIGGWKLLQVLTQGTDTSDVQLTPH